jgi:mannose-6-phosphate isomerase
MKTENNKSENRPWGEYKVLLESDNYKIKLITVNPEQRLSYQYHHKRNETWTIVYGTGKFMIDDSVFNVKYGDTLKINKGQRHRIECTSKEPLKFVEVQTGEYFGEDDIVRIEDSYNRV